MKSAQFHQASGSGAVMADGIHLPQAAGCAGNVSVSLADYIAASLCTPFCWGIFDCVTFAAQWVRIKTGADPLEGLPAWTNEAEAMAVIEAEGGLVEALDARFRRIDPNYACDGDLTVYDGAVMIYSGHQVVGPGPRGLQFLSHGVAHYAWRVGA